MKSFVVGILLFLAVFTLFSVLNTRLAGIYNVFKLVSGVYDSNGLRGGLNSEDDSKIFLGKKSVYVPDVILSTGVEMPVIAAGTWQYNSYTAEKSVYEALKAGFNHIDTAYNYHNQDGVGKAIKKYIAESEGIGRSDIFITTKVPGCGSDGVSFENCGDDTNKIIRKDLEMLGVEHVDLLLVHFSPLGKGIEKGCGKENCNAMRHQWKALQHAFFVKKARSVGVSNFCKECIDCILNWEETIVLPTVNQIQYHVGMGADPEGIVSYSKKKGMVVQAYSPLGNKNEKLVSEKSSFDTIAKDHSKSVPQIALRWSIEHEVAVVTKSTNPKHMAENLDIFEWKLKDSEMRDLDEQSEPFDTPSFTCSDAKGC